MDQDVALGVTMAVTQADLAILRETARLGEYPVVYRVHRMQQGGGYGDVDKHPFAWGVLVYVDGQLARINSARGQGREWNDLDKAGDWLRSQGFSYWWTRNDLEIPGAGDAVTEDETAPGHHDDEVDQDANENHAMGKDKPIPKPKFTLK